MTDNKTDDRPDDRPDEPAGSGPPPMAPDKLLTRVIFVAAVAIATTALILYLLRGL